MMALGSNNPIFHLQFLVGNSVGDGDGSCSCGAPSLLPSTAEDGRMLTAVVRFAENKIAYAHDWRLAERRQNPNGYVHC